ncbi:MAG TPA: RnfABCDGE type electron transport complex subunit D [Gemmatimonadaceae bacterium]|nr:RnfABCDGE type electron transport complex subunit D [Gemmatimonadaceae bacterium]
MTLGRFVRTPKGITLLVLGVLMIVSAAGDGARLVLPGVAGAVIAAVIIDAAMLRARKHRWVFPDGALITAIIVAAVLSPHMPWYVATATAAAAVISKYIFRGGPANVFNPAALALVVTFYPLHTGQSWWGALSDLPPAGVAVLVAGGAFTVYRVNKLPVALAFLGAYFTLLTVTAFVGSPAPVASLYRAPDIHAALYFAFFMVTDPPTSPPSARSQLIFGAIVAIAVYAAFELIGAAYFRLAGLLIGNAWEGLRRHRERAARTAAIRPRAQAPAPPSLTDRSAS